MACSLSRTGHRAATCDRTGRAGSAVRRSAGGRPQGVRRGAR
ncbi:hypothetical protein D8M33_12105, partial [Micrococcus sp. HSID17245]